MQPFQTFETIVGHENVLAGLRGAINDGKLGHSHLFHGPKGVGKATVAKAFAQILLCKTPQVARSSSCGQCPSCQKMVEGQHPDFIKVEMPEGKTRISVDQIRELTAFLSLTPMESTWKIALIDDASQMNEAAANALLKTLEEPPEQSILIVNTFRPGVLLPTIRSRCAKTRFSGLDKDELHKIVASLIDGDAANIRQAVELCGGNVAQAVKLCEADVHEERDRFVREIGGLNPGNLNTICTMAEHWSQAARFSTIPILLKAWFQEQIRDSVRKQDEDETLRSWLDLQKLVDELLERTVEVNLNRRLVLESIFIRLARLRGAGF